VEVYTAELAVLVIIVSTMRASLGLLDAVDGNPVLHDFDHAFRHQEGRSFTQSRK